MGIKCRRWHAQSLLFILLVHSPYKFLPKRIKEFSTVHLPVSQLQLGLIEIAQVNAKGTFKILGYFPYIIVPVVKHVLIMQGINQFYQRHFATCPFQLLLGFRFIFFEFVIQLVFDVDLYQIVGYYLGDLVVVRG